MSKASTKNKKTNQEQDSGGGNRKECPSMSQHFMIVHKNPSMFSLFYHITCYSFKHWPMKTHGYDSRGALKNKFWLQPCMTWQNKTLSITLHLRCLCSNNSDFFAKYGVNFLPKYHKKRPSPFALCFLRFWST